MGALAEEPDFEPIICIYMQNVNHISLWKSFVSERTLLQGRLLGPDSVFAPAIPMVDLSLQRGTGVPGNSEFPVLFILQIDTTSRRDVTLCMFHILGPHSTGMRPCNV